MPKSTLIVPKNSAVPPEEDNSDTKERTATQNQETQRSSLKPSSLQSAMSILPASKYSAMRALLLTLQTLFGGQPENYVDFMEKSFYEIGGNAENSLIAVICLQHYKYKIDVLNFLKARSLKEIVMKMFPLGEKISSSSWTELEKTFKHKRMRRHDLGFLFECFQAENIRPEDVPEDWTDLWKLAIAKGNHFIFKRKQEKSPVGVVLNFDINDDVHSKLAAAITGRSLTTDDIQKYSFQMSSKSVLIELLQFIGESSRKKGKLLQPIFFTKKGLKDPELVAIMILMEISNFTYAKKHKFKWIITSYPKLLQAQVERQILSFEVLLENHADGRNLFDQYRCIFAAKKV